MKASMRQYFVETLWPISAAAINLKATLGPRKDTLSDDTEVEVTLFVEDGAVLVTIGGVFTSAGSALTKSETFAHELFGDLGINEAVSGRIHPVRVNIIDVCGYSNHLQDPVAEHENADGPRKPPDDAVGAK